jgi:hypothetical protein
MSNELFSRMMREIPLAKLGGHVFGAIFVAEISGIEPAKRVLYKKRLTLFLV